MLLACTLAAPARAQAEPNGESWRLFQSLHACLKLELRVPPGPCQVAAELLAQGLRQASKLDVAVVQGASGGRNPAVLRMLVGTLDEAELQPLARALGCEPVPGGFRVLAQEFTQSGDALVAVLEDPVCVGRPLCLVLGNDPEALAAYLDEVPRLSRPHLWVHGDGELALECPLELDGTPRAELAQDYRARRARYFAAEKTQTFEGLTVHVPGEFPRDEWVVYGKTLAAAEKRVRDWLGASEPPAIELYLYERLADFEECLGSSELSVNNRLRPRVHVLLAPGMPDDGGAGLARAAARVIAGTPVLPWIEEGLAVAAADAWWGQPLDEWLGHLARGKLLPTADELFAPGVAENFSVHALAPARALLFRQVALAGGVDPQRVRALWKGSGGDQRRTATLYRSGVQAALKPARGEFLRQKGAPPVVAPFRHGLALVEGAGASYSARAIEGTLLEAHALGQGPDTIGLTILATGEDPRAPLYAARARPAHGSASDAALASAAATVRALGQGLFLSLEVLSHPNGAWADVLSWTGADDQARFFARYERVALHYALLAELLQAELFSFGSNLRESTRTEIKEERRDQQRLQQRRSAWPQLIARLRGAYGGSVTCGARFPSEIEEVGFLEQLDYLGLLLYPRLPRDGGAPADDELARMLRFQVQQALDLAVRWNRPLLFLQIGCPARVDAGAWPLVPRGARDLVAQQRYFEVLADVLAGPLENREALRGYFLWNWPLDEALAGPADGGFSLRGKPVESALRRLFAR